MSESGSLLRDMRLRAGLSQNDLAQRSGVDKTLISAYENGRRVPSGDALLRLLRCAGAVINVTTTVERARGAAAQLEQVAALAMTLPRRPPGPLRYPIFRTFVGA